MNYSAAIKIMPRVPGHVIHIVRQCLRRYHRDLRILIHARTNDFSTKVYRRMKFDRNPLLPVLQDKLRVKDYAKARGIQTAITLHVTSTPEKVPGLDLPPTCFVKANHGCGWNLMRLADAWIHYRHGRKFAGCTPDEIIAKANGELLSDQQMISKCRQWLAARHDPRQWAYQEIEPIIFAEETLRPAHAEELLDYRLYTFNGTVRAINVGSPGFRARCENAFFTPDWELIPLTRYRRERLPAVLPPRPGNLEAMIEAARVLGEGIDFVRIDMYDTVKGLVLGEMTVYPQAGRPGTPTDCPVFNRWLGNQWDVDRRHYIG